MNFSVRSWKTLSLGMCLAACAAEAAPSAAAPASPLLGDCSNDLDQYARRDGHAGVSSLLYPCAGDACTGNEGFAQDVRHSISVEVTAAPEAVLVLESSDPNVFTVADVGSTFDPCAARFTAWATLDARGVGDAELRVRDASGELDAIPIRVANPATIVLRATPSDSFAFESTRASLLATAGESWLLLPELYDAQRALLVGLPTLTWEVDDEAVAEVRTEPRTESEALLRDNGALGMAFLEAKKSGETSLRVRTSHGAETKLALRVVAP